MNISPDELLRFSKVELAPWQRDLIEKLGKPDTRLAILIPRRDPFRRLVWEVAQLLDKGFG